MKFYVLLVLLVSTCLARPDVSHLLPQQPSNEYLPSISTPKTLLIDTRTNIEEEHLVQPSGIVEITPIPSGSSTTTEKTRVSSTVQSIKDRFNNPQPSVNVIGSGSIPTGSYLPTSGLINIGAETSGGDGNIIGLPGIYNPQFEQSERSVYFFAAPEEQTQSRLRINIIPSGQQSTRVIFIKAPTYPAPIPEVISTPSETNDKTIIYVLSRKPDSLAPISIPASTAVNPSKPEIYFIKYGTKNEAEEAISSGISGQVVGTNILDLQNAQSFIKTIQDIGIGGSASGVTITGGSDISGSTASISDFVIGSTTEGTKFGPAGESGPYF